VSCVVPQRSGNSSATPADAAALFFHSHLVPSLHTPDADSITVGEACELWLRHNELEGLERGSLKTHRDCPCLHIVPMIGKKKLSRLTTPLIEEFRYQLLISRDGGGR
jgi:integrase